MEVLVGEMKVVVVLAAVTVVVMLSCRWKAPAEVRELKKRERREMGEKIYNFRIYNFIIYIYIFF